MQWMRAVTVVFVFFIVAGAGQALASEPQITNSGDNLRTGWYPEASTITPQLVSGGTFGQLWSAPVEGQVYAQHPDCEISREDDALLDPQEGEVVLTQELTLTSSEVFPIRRHPQFAAANDRPGTDPLAGITTALEWHLLPA